MPADLADVELRRRRRRREVTSAVVVELSRPSLGVKLVGIKIVVRGRENLRPGQNYIFMSNHVSNLDPDILIPSIPGRCSVLVKKELFRTPILGTGMKMAQLVPVDRSDREAAIESVQAAQVSLDSPAQREA